MPAKVYPLDKATVKAIIDKDSTIIRYRNEIEKLNIQKRRQAWGKKIRGRSQTIRDRELKRWLRHTSRQLHQQLKDTTPDLELHEIDIRKVARGIQVIARPAAPAVEPAAPAQTEPHL
jgi:hypothetical protein